MLTHKLRQWRCGRQPIFSSLPGVPSSLVQNRPPPPPALVTSGAFGAVGAVLLLAGLASGSEPVLIGSGAAGSLSLISALVWRSQLIEAWRREHPRR